MAWTSPRTWVSGETVTAALMNTHVRDNLKAIGDAWSTWTPTWAATTTNPTLGNGTLDAAHITAGKLFIFQIDLTIGSTTNPGSGTYSFTLPVTPASGGRLTFYGSAFDTSAANTYPIAGIYTGGVLSLRQFPGTAGGAFATLTHASPFAWATGDVLSIGGTLEVA